MIAATGSRVCTGSRASVPAVLRRPMRVSRRRVAARERRRPRRPVRAAPTLRLRRFPSPILRRVARARLRRPHTAKRRASCARRTPSARRAGPASPSRKRRPAVPSPRTSSASTAGPRFPFAIRLRPLRRSVTACRRTTAAAAALDSVGRELLPRRALPLLPARTARLGPRATPAFRIPATAPQPMAVPERQAPRKLRAIRAARATAAARLRPAVTPQAERPSSRSSASSPPFAVAVASPDARRRKASAHHLTDRAGGAVRLERATESAPWPVLFRASLDQPRRIPKLGELHGGDRLRRGD